MGNAKKLPIADYQLPHSPIHRGFTLIEIIVTITIIAILSSIALPAYSLFLKKERILTAGKNLKSLIRDAQSRAYTNEVDCAVCDCTVNNLPVLKGWYVDFGRSATYQLCLDKNSTDYITSVPKQFSVAENIRITPYLNPLLTPAALVFYPYPPSVDQDARICIGSPELPNTYYVINVSKAGLISDAGGLHDSPAECP